MTAGAPLRHVRDVVGAARFRANPAYEALPLDALTAEEAAGISDLAGEDDVAGVLRPRHLSGLVVKAVDADTLDLIDRLAKPGFLPAGAARHPVLVAALVLDGVLEIDAGMGFVSGTAAASLFVEGLAGSAPTGRLARLSRVGLQAAQRCGVVDSRFLTMMLYRHNTAPASPQVLAQLGEDSAAYLGLRDPSARSRLEEHWVEVSPADTDGWHAWHPRDGGGPPAYKLYVSPAPEVVPEAFAAVVTALAADRPPPFKVGRGPYGLLRPDKLVAYFPSLPELRRAARRVMKRLEGCPAQGVPFTAELDGDGLLSWGTDPPATGRGWVEGESWRHWLTMRLAVALTTAQAGPQNGLEPWEFAMRRILLDGVDPVSWTPVPAIWSAAA